VKGKQQRESIPPRIDDRVHVLEHKQLRKRRVSGHQEKEIFSKRRVDLGLVDMKDINKKGIVSPH